MRKRLIALAALLLLSAPALILLRQPPAPPISFDALRRLVLARDFTATDAALEAAHTSYTSAHTPDAERDLYNVFALSDPAIQGFTEDWARDQPDNPRALTAKGWNLYAWGNFWRGRASVNNTTDEAMSALMQRHTAAFPLFKQATKLAPDLIPASDGLLRLTATLGNKSVIPRELERIMNSQPNRGSLMRAMVALAPQWGGRPEQVNLLCDRYAPKITDIKDYSPEICRIDAVYYADFWYGDQRAAAHQLLMFTDHPILDNARYNDMMDGLTSPEDSIVLLEKIKADGEMASREARKLDTLRNQINNVSPMEAKYPELAIALSREVPYLHDALLQDPLNPYLLHRYIGVLFDAAEYANRPVTLADKAEITTRLHAALKAVPTAPQLWIDLAEITLRWQDLDSIAKAEPYFHNAIYYSRYGTDEFADAARPKLQMVQDQSNLIQAVDISGMTPEQLAKLDEIVNCPLAVQLSILRVVCQNTGTPENQCAEGAATNDVVWDRLNGRINAGACFKEFKQRLEDIYEKPAKVDF